MDSKRWSALAVACLVVLAGCPLGSGSSPSSVDGSTPVETTAEPREQATGGASSTATQVPETTGVPATPSPDSSATPRSTATPTRTATPTGTATPTTDQSSEYSIPVTGNESLPFDVNRTFARTVKLLGVEGYVEAPSEIYVQEAVERWKPAVENPFSRTLVDARETPTATNNPDVEGILITKQPGQSTLRLRLSVVHEMVHSLQAQRATDTPTYAAVFGRGNGVSQAAAWALWEGSASYVAAEYMRTYTNHTEAEIRAKINQYSSASPAGKLFWSTYQFGRLYTADRVNEPADVWKLYENPPNTTEQVIHGAPPGSELPSSLSVSVAAEGWSVTTRETRGELFVRSVLTSELTEQRAASGAAGWGNDVLVNVSTGDDAAYAWAIRWDDSANATEFVETFRAVQDNRTDGTDGTDDRWVVDGTAVGVERVAPQTVIVLTGPESFVTTAVVSGENGNVTVTRSG